MTQDRLEEPSPVVHIDDIEPEKCGSPESPYGQEYRVVTPYLEAMGGRLGANVVRLRPGQVCCPFHYHLIEDEVFFILSGTGVLRYGDRIHRLRAGCCVSCPAGTERAHQIANDGAEDLIYLAVGPNEPREVCVYPDSGKVLVRGLRKVGYLEAADYMAGEPNPPKIFDLAKRSV